jgi:hypothetical protein
MYLKNSINIDIRKFLRIHGHVFYFVENFFREIKFCHWIDDEKEIINKGLKSHIRKKIIFDFLQKHILITYKIIFREPYISFVNFWQ